MEDKTNVKKERNNLILNYTERPKVQIGLFNEVKLEERYKNWLHLQIGGINIERNKRDLATFSIGIVNISNNPNSLPLGHVNILNERETMCAGKINLINDFKSGCALAAYGNYIIFFGNSGNIESPIAVAGLVNFVIKAKNGVMVGLINIVSECEKCYQVGLINIDFSAKIKFIPFFAKRKGENIIDEKEKIKPGITIDDIKQIAVKIFLAKAEKSLRKRPEDKEKIKQKMMQEIKEIKEEVSILAVIWKSMWRVFVGY